MDWNDLSPPWQACVEEVWAAYCAGSLPIGAAITDAKGQIIARGRNRLFEKTADSPYLYGRLAHAEMNAVRAFEKTANVTTESTVYTSLEPCPMCISTLRLNRFKAIHFAAHDAVAGSVDLLDANEFMRIEAPEIVNLNSREFKVMLLGLLTETVLRLDLPRGKMWLPIRIRACPEAVQLGQALHSSGELVEMQEQGVLAIEMFESIAAKL